MKKHIKKGENMGKDINENTFTTVSEPEDDHFIKDYKQDDARRASFNRLADSIFGIQFEEWYQQGFWNDNYICYSFCGRMKWFPMFH